MKIASLIGVHSNPLLVMDTVAAVRKYVTDDIALIVEGRAWKYFSRSMSSSSIHMVEGEIHNRGRHVYRNIIKGLREAFDKWPVADWYCYSEFDTLFTSDGFRSDLRAADAKGCPMAVVDLMEKRNSGDCFFLSGIIPSSSINCCKVLGSLMFFSNRCMKEFDNIELFDKMLSLNYSDIIDPNYFKDYSLEEVLFPTVARKFGDLYKLNTKGKESNKYKVRFAREFSMEDIVGNPNITVIHPSKNLNTAVREYYAGVRNGSAMASKYRKNIM